ncbi:transforming protein [Human papillomavirus 139]|uniref:Protein E6 n=1 Tax=Human papillomavirus 139 TaxID=1070412 RepID=I6MRE1_9PAPI|nr:transforming protein [Human papillomavirus 139]
MEPQESNVYGLCVLNGCSLETLCVPCLFCRSNLSFQDIVSFIIKRLRVVLRDNTFFAACSACLRLSAAYEQEHYSQCVATSDFVKYVCDGNVAKLNVRCTFCMKKLDSIEILDTFASGTEFTLVRGIWRAACRLCK